MYISVLFVIILMLMGSVLYIVPPPAPPETPTTLTSAIENGPRTYTIGLVEFSEVNGLIRY